MKINVKKIKQLRAEQGWSQEQLSELCGVNLRTIQRVESRGTASLETVRAMAAVFDLTPEQLAVDETTKSSFQQHRVVQVVVDGIVSFDDFHDRSSRFDFWWFFLFFILALALADVIHVAVTTFVAIVLLVPFLAASTRRLNDAGQSPWWQLLYLVPFGMLVVFYLLAIPGNKTASDNSVKQPVDTKRA